VKNKAGDAADINPKKTSFIKKSDAWLMRRTGAPIALYIMALGIIVLITAAGLISSAFLLSQRDYGAEPTMNTNNAGTQSTQVAQRNISANESAGEIITPNDPEPAPEEVDELSLMEDCHRQYNRSPVYAISGSRVYFISENSIYMLDESVADNADPDSVAVPGQVVYDSQLHSIIGINDRYLLYTRGETDNAPFTQSVVAYGLYDGQKIDLLKGIYDSPVYCEGNDSIYYGVRQNTLAVYRYDLGTHTSELAFEDNGISQTRYGAISMATDVKCSDFFGRPELIFTYPKGESKTTLRRVVLDTDNSLLADQQGYTPGARYKYLSESAWLKLGKKNERFRGIPATVISWGGSDSVDLTENLVIGENSCVLGADGSLYFLRADGWGETDNALCRADSTGRGVFLIEPVNATGVICVQEHLLLASDDRRGNIKFSLYNYNYNYDHDDPQKSETLDAFSTSYSYDEKSGIAHMETYNRYVAVIYQSNVIEVIDAGREIERIIKERDAKTTTTAAQTTVLGGATTNLTTAGQEITTTTIAVTPGN